MPGESRLPRPTIGGQAVLEGVMMRGGSSWAVAVRTPAGEIRVERFTLTPPAARSRVLRLPVVRGVAALAEALRIGVRALALSADLQLAPDARRGPSARADAAVLALALVLGIGLFLVVPAALARLADQAVLVEAALRAAILVGYFALLGRRPGMRRLFAYHGAEHKAVACHEAGLPLTPEHAAGCSRLHPRCGTSFLALALIVASAAVVPLGEPPWPWLVASRVLVAPVAAGLAFEAVRWAVGAGAEQTLAPVVELQRLTTLEPGREHLEVALAALGAVLPAEDEPAPRLRLVTG